MSSSGVIKRKVFDMDHEGHENGKKRILEDSKKSEVKSVYSGEEYSWKGYLKTTYDPKHGIFHHSLHFDKQQQVPESILYGQLSLREEDQLLLLNEDELSLASHDKVLGLFRILSLDEKIRLVYAPNRHSEQIRERIFCIVLRRSILQSSGYRITFEADIFHTNTVDDNWLILRSERTIKKTSTQKFLKTVTIGGIQKLLFGDVIIPESVPSCILWQENGSLFQQELYCYKKCYPQIMRFFKHIQSGKYMTIDQHGCLGLCSCQDGHHSVAGCSQKDDKCCGTAFEMQTADDLSFRVLLEYQTQRILKYEWKTQKGCFERCKNHDIGSIGNEFKFEINPPNP